MNLLDSLENFLSTFQKDLSAVSGQISTLQDRSKDIENRLKSRRVPYVLPLVCYCRSDMTLRKSRNRYLTYLWTSVFHRNWLSSSLIPPWVSHGYQP